MALPDPIAQAIGARTAALIAVLARAAFDRFWADVQAGTPPQEAIQKAQAGFGGAFADQLAAAFGEILQQSIGVADVRDMPVGDVTLSRKLHRHNIQTEQEVTGIIRRHAQGVLQARELSIRLYDGYNPQDGIQRPLEGAARAKLPKYLRWLTEDKPTRDGLTALQVQGQEQAARLKSVALRAGYLEAIEEWKRGAATDALQRRLQVAQREQNRWFANRIAQTELARAHQSRVAAEFLADETIDAVQVVLNPLHPRTDICDLHARADLYGLGPGVYPKKLAPRPPYHPFCWCVLRSKPSLFGFASKPVPNGPQAFLRSLSDDEAARVMGSRGKRDAVLRGTPPEDVINAGQDPAYRLVRLGDPRATETPVKPQQQDAGP